MFRRTFLTSALTVGLLVSTITMGTVPIAQAYTPNDKGETNVTADPGTWCQGCTSAQGAKFDYNTLDLGWGNGSGLTMGGAGCAQFSMTYVLRKSGVKGSDFDPKKLKEWNESVPVAKSTVNEGGSATWNLGDISGGKLTFEGRLRSLDAIKTAFEGGYYVIIHTSGTTSAGHWVALDEIKDGEIYVVDSAANGENGQVSFAKTYQNFLHPDLDSVVFKPADGTTPANKAPTVKGVASGNGGSSSGNDAAATGEFGVISEEELHGMPDFVSLAEGAEPLSPPAYNALDLSAKNVLADLKETRKTDKESYGQANYLGVAVSVMGILMMMWAVLQVAVYILDYSLQGILNLYPIVTAGQRRVAYSSDYLEGFAQQPTSKPHPVGFTGMGVMAGATFLVGVLVYQGTVFSILEMGWKFVKSVVELGL